MNYITVISQQEKYIIKNDYSGYRNLCYGNGCRPMPYSAFKALHNKYNADRQAISEYMADTDEDFFNF